MTEATSKKPKPEMKWPNVGQLVWSDPNSDQGSTYHAREVDYLPMAWRVMKETHTTVHLSAVKKKPGQALAETWIVHKDNPQQVEELYVSEQAVWQARVAHARQELRYANEALARGHREVRQATKRRHAATMELARTLKRAGK